MKRNTGTMVVIATNGTTKESEIEVKEIADRVRTQLDDYLEIVPRFTRFRGQACVAFCGEHGKLKHLDVNEAATALWRAQVPVRVFLDFLVGPVCILYGPPEFMRAM